MPDFKVPQGYSLFKADLDYISGIFNFTALRSAKILITGGTGFLGVWLTEALLWAAAAHDVDISLTVTGSGSEAAWLRRYPQLKGRGSRQLAHQRADFSAPVRLKGEFSHIIHAATLPNDLSPTWAHRHWQVAMGGAQAVARLAERCGATVLVLSSGGIHKMPHLAGEMGQTPDQGQRPGPPDYSNLVLTEPFVYGCGKHVAEGSLLAAGASGGFKVVVARPFSLIGPWLPLNVNYAAGNFIRDALDGGPIRIEGDGTPLRSFMHMTDLVVWLLSVLLYGKSDFPYDIGGNEVVSIAELARRVAACAALPPTAVEIALKAEAGAVPSAYLPNAAFTRCELGLSAGLNLNETIHRTLLWYRERRDKK